jgi:signal transduction histidine kinase/CheY-like chemotaxis protein
VINDADGGFTDVHAACLQDWGFPSEHPVGLNIAQVLPPELIPTFFQTQQKVLAQQSMLQGEYQLRDPKLGPRFREFRMVPHGPQKTLTMIRDVTQRQMEQQAHLQVVKQLQQAQKMDALGQLTGGVAHDFNNILASILGYAWLGLQQTNEATNPKMVEYLEVISSAGERGRDLVQKMLAFSRRSSDLPTVAQDPIPALKEAFQILKSLIPSSISLSLEVPDSCPALAIDPTELHQAVVNMVLNSRDALQGSGEIAIVLRPLAPYGQACASCHRTTADSYIAISVRDNGSGMSSALLDRIFDPFFTTKPVGSGTGIGLAVVEGIVHRLGGHILVETQENHGTEIRLLFPAAPSAGGGLTESAVSPTENWRAGNALHHLMVVDDEIWIGTFLREFLREDGYSVSVFTDSRAALAAIEAAPNDYTAVITDLTMPHLGGLELAAEIHLRHPHIPIVLCTGTDEITTAERAREVGIFGILPKPIPVVELRALLREILAGADNARTAKPSELGGLT